MKPIEIKAFNRFLKEHAYYPAWIKNVHICGQEKWHGIPRFKNYYEYLTFIQPSNAVLCYFKFVKTPEGWDFWQNVNSEWRAYIYYKTI